MFVIYWDVSVNFFVVLDGFRNSLKLPLLGERTDLLLSSQSWAIEHTYSALRVKKYKQKFCLLPVLVNLPARLEISDSFDTLDLDEASLSKLSSNIFFSSTKSCSSLILRLLGDGKDST